MLAPIKRLPYREDRDCDVFAWSRMVFHGVVERKRDVFFGTYFFSEAFDHATDVFFRAGFVECDGSGRVCERVFEEAAVCVFVTGAEWWVHDDGVCVFVSEFKVGGYYRPFSRDVFEVVCE